MRKMIIIFTTTLMLANSSQAIAAMPVIDAANLANSARQVTSWGEQLIAMKTQLDQTKQHYIALTGSRGLGTILYNPELRKYLPLEYQNIYDASSHGNYGISSLIANITTAEKLNGTISEMQKHIEERSLRNAITDKAVSLKGYEGSKLRLNQIESLMKQISNTQDLKAIGELQARISLEQASIQSELTKLQMIGHLREAEQKLVQEQKRDLSRRLLNSNNTEMPRIQ